MLVAIVGTTVFSASVGDSRAVVGTTSPPDLLPAPQASLGEERKVLEEVKMRRRSKTNPLIQPVQLTKDQKPEDPEEFQRILKHNGRVQRLCDSGGNSVGPYRVWESDSNAPGLAMSRSIGDGGGKKVGVIATPILSRYELNTDSDLFVVLASDGVWDVMDNEDVVNFVDCFREKCVHGNIKSNKDLGDVTPAVTCISHLLCEESRLRWYSIVEDEDVIIDDISCIVMEFRKSEIPICNFQSRGVVEVEEPSRDAEESQKGLKKAPTLNQIITRDPRRGSVVNDKGSLEEKIS